MVREDACVSVDDNGNLTSGGEWDGRGRRVE